MSLHKIIASGNINFKTTGEIAPNVITSHAPRLLMWFTNGQTCSDKLPIPSGNGKLNYVESLRLRCQKAVKTNTPIIFVYAGKLLTDQQKEAIESMS